MPIVRTPRPDRGYLVISNAVVRDERLSYRARGLLAAILSRPDDWRTSARAMAKESPDGEHAILAALSELEAAGYVIRIRERDARGRVRTETRVYDSPQHEGAIGASAGQMDQSTGPGESGTGLPGTGETPRFRKTDDVVPITKNLEEAPLPAAVRERNPYWDALEVVMGHGPEIGEDSLWGRFTTMVRNEGHDPGEIRIRAIRLAATWGPQTVTVPSLERHWQRMGTRLGGMTKADGDALAAQIAGEARRQRLEASDHAIDQRASTGQEGAAK